MNRRLDVWFFKDSQESILFYAFAMNRWQGENDRVIISKI